MLQRKWIVNTDGRLLAVWTDLSAVTQAQATAERRVGVRSRRTRRSVAGRRTSRFPEAQQALVVA
jgi:hypothetical protein